MSQAYPVNHWITIIHISINHQLKCYDHHWPCLQVLDMEEPLDCIPGQSLPAAALKEDESVPSWEIEPPMSTEGSHSRTRWSWLDWGRQAWDWGAMRRSIKHSSSSILSDGQPESGAHRAQSSSKTCHSTRNKLNILKLVLSNQIK